MSKNILTIIDYDCGNILNLVRAIEFLGYKVEVSKDKKKIINSSHVILPGVGAFGNATQKLEKFNLNSIILEYVKSGKPLLGICLGMQLLLTESHEFGTHKGLDLIKGKVIKISNKDKKEIKIPHVGWNDLYPNNEEEIWTNKILKGFPSGKSFYFIHSYICKTKSSKATVAYCDYSGISIPAVISIDNIFGCQFHPEKSSDNGLIVLKIFCEIQ